MYGATRMGSRPSGPPEVNPFSAPSANAHPHFMPSRATPAEGGSVGSTPAPAPVVKPPKAPEKPLVPYMRFSRAVWHKVREENKDCPVHDVGRKIGTLWRELSDKEKAVYQEQWEAEKVDYDKQMKAYHNSPAYQAYLAAKSGQIPLGPGKKDGGRGSGGRQESGVFIQPVDEDDGGEFQVSLRKLAALRYDRNQRLMAELMSDSWVGDSRNVVTQQRMAMLKRQANSLSTHQQNLETELRTLEEKFTKKRRLMADASGAFAAKLGDVNAQRPTADPALYASMTAKAEAALLKAFHDSKAQPPAATAAPAASPTAAVATPAAPEASPPAAQPAPAPQAPQEAPPQPAAPAAQENPAPAAPAANDAPPAPVSEA